MTLTFFTNLVNHHQIPVADEFYTILGDNYRYVAMELLPDWLVSGGYDPTISRSYILRSYESEEAQKEAKRLMLESDVVIAAYAPEETLLERKSQNKITFDYSERWNKQGGVHLFDPRKLKNIYRRSFRYRNNRLYMLCASAYAASDVHFYGCYPHKTFKWGYMTKVDMHYSRPSFAIFPSECEVKLMWCARFINWKHPEFPIMLAKHLKNRGYSFHINMYGSGILFDDMLKLSNELEVNDVITFLGNEGWGAVANEAMANGCVLIGSHEIGSIPFLVQDGINGLIFKSNDLNSFIDKVEWALNHIDESLLISTNAIKTMQDLWSPINAARSFLKLVDDLQNDRPVSILQGPCSRAE